MNAYAIGKKDQLNYYVNCLVMNDSLMVMENLHYNSSTPYDDTFRTECVRMKEWMIPLINEMFGTSYDIHSTVALYENEQMMLAAVDTEDLEQKGIPRKITDTIVGIENQLYHLECQTNEDGTILLRVVTYDLQAAVQSGIYDNSTNTLTIQIPQSAVIFLKREKRSAPMTVIYQCGDQQMRVSIPTLSVQSYSLEEIFDKRLYFLIPYYFIRYEDSFDHGIGLDNEQIQMDIEQMNQRLYELCEKGIITEVQLTDLVQLIQTIVKQITRKLDDEERERLVKSMGGKVLEMESDKILERGRRNGFNEGILRALKSLKERYPSEEVYAQLKMLFELTDEEAASYMKM